MDLITVDSKQAIKVLPQLVPDSACFRCDVCCRFPEADSFLRPYFTSAEINDAVAHGVPESFFPNKAGSQVHLVENPTGEGYLCPAFDSKSGLCGIYDVRPLDCRLYPLALMWDASGREVQLGWDSKCPFVRDAHSSAIREYGDRVATFLADEAIVEAIAAHPRLVGRFQEDVVVLKALPHLTVRLGPKPVDPQLRPLTLQDAAGFAKALDRAQVIGHDTPAAFAFPYHYIWTSLLPYWWMEFDHTLFLFAESPDGWFMPLPPLGAGPLDQAVEEAFALMRSWNGPSPVSRIENVMESQRRLLECDRIQFRRKEGDYLYPVEALVALAGDHYKSQRALCNRVARERVITSEPYRAGHQAGCTLLYRRWAQQKRRGNLDQMGALLLEDAEMAHALVFEEHERIGLSGTIVRVNGDIAAYTFGYRLTPLTWCILLEVADRSITGLAQWLFRDTCRTALAQGAASINAMDDGGLPGLRAAKSAYHPTAVLDTWTITRTTT
ncbi:MAG: phosphatidylglycerol lysyltransferase domain-containing protein [Nitrospira sp.]|nr:phosphatidylglycerol lysyltransferase domain-containing protein [Nitrospira sp.]